MKRLLLVTIIFLFPFYAQAGFPEGENGYDLKKIEESFRLPCDEIGNDDCIARALGVGACTWVFGINKDKDPAEALKIADNVLIALLKGNNLDLKRLLLPLIADISLSYPINAGVDTKEKIFYFEALVHREYL